MVFELALTFWTVGALVEWLARDRDADVEVDVEEGTLGDLEHGDILKVDRGLYDHYGVYDAEKEIVIHYANENGDSGFKGKVSKASIEEFADGASLISICYFSEDDEGNVQLTSIKKIRI